MQALLLRRWIKGVAVAGLLSALLPAAAFAGWPWSRTAPAPAIPVGPPIYTPSTTPTVVGYQPAPVPAAVAPTLSAPPVAYGPATTYAPAPAVVAAPTVGACPGNCATVPRVTGYTPPNYHTSYMQVPTTTYRPVAAIDPATGLPINAVQPCTTPAYYARRVPTPWWGGLWPASSAPPTVVAYTPATIAAYPAQPVVTNYAPTVIAPRPLPVVTQYAPPQTQIVTNYAPAPVVTQYAPQPVVTQYAPAPVTTQYAPQPTVTQYAPAPAPVTIPTTPAPTSPCPPDAPVISAPTNGAYPAPQGGYSNGSVPANSQPSLNSPGTYPNGTIVPQSSAGDAASVAPRLDSSTVPGTTRSYTPAEYDNLPVVPVQPPAERRVIETPRIEGSQLQSPQSSAPAIRSPAPFVPFARPTDRPASAPVPQSNLRLVPDPDVQKLDLRKNEIPNLIKPGNRTTQRVSPREVASVPINWPAQPTTTHKPATRPQPQLIPASISAPKLDDSGWRSVAP